MTNEQRAEILKSGNARYNYEAMEITEGTQKEEHRQVVLKSKDALANEQRKNIFKALSDFQKEIPIMNQKAKGYGYTYADFASIVETITPFLEKHNIGFTQLLQGSQLETIIFHADSGESLTSIADIPKNVSLKGMNDYQSFGSGITYFRRYTLSSILGIVTEKDNDASGEQDRKTATPKAAPIDGFSKKYDAKIDFELQLGNAENISEISRLYESNKEFLSKEANKELLALFSKRKNELGNINK